MKNEKITGIVIPIKSLWVLILYLIFIAFSPIIFSKFYSGVIFTSESGAIGDTIGGITAPFINLLAAFLVYLSFKEQIRANDKLSRENSFNYISNLFNLIINSIKEKTLYKYTITIKGKEIDKITESLVEWIINWLQALKNDELFGQRISVVKQQIPKEYEPSVKARIINKQLDESLFDLFRKLVDLHNLEKEINTALLDDGMKSHYILTISKMLNYLELRPLLLYFKQFNSILELGSHFEYLSDANLMRLKTVYNILIGFDNRNYFLNPLLNQIEV
jgi:hypothetical protein